MTRSGSGAIAVGVVGASQTGWAAAAHLPALAALPDFRLVGVATTREESARATAQTYDVPLAFGDWTALVEHPDIDLVVVAVKVPDHAAIVGAAVAAGKHVYSEWPLGRDLHEARELETAAIRHGVRHAIGLQGPHAASTRYVRELIREGRLGRVQSVGLVAAAPMNGSRITANLRWATDPAAGVDNLTITGGHVLATVGEILGEPTVLTAVLRNPSGETTVAETGERVGGLPPNQVVAAGVFPDGALLSLCVQGGNPPVAAGFHLTIMGEEGSLTIRPSGRPGSMWITGWTIEAHWPDGSLEELPTPSRFHRAPARLRTGPTANVAELYEELGRAMTTGVPLGTDFTAAVRLHRQLDRMTTLSGLVVEPDAGVVPVADES